VDLFDVVILALRLLLVALLYLFLLTVLRIAARALWPVAPTSARSQVAALQLVVVDAGNSSLNEGQVLEFADGTTLGRAGRADVAFADPAVSSEHARIDRVGRAWVVTDLGSTNGTRLNDEQVTGHAPLASGDILGVGTVRLRVQAH
jgi:pSer/pThr/pTyr-binding forkhead associated (FHA) protein